MIVLIGCALILSRKCPVILKMPRHANENFLVVIYFVSFLVKKMGDNSIEHTDQKKSQVIKTRKTNCKRETLESHKLAVSCRV